MPPCLSGSSPRSARLTAGRVPVIAGCGSNDTSADRVVTMSLPSLSKRVPPGKFSPVLATVHCPSFATFRTSPAIRPTIHRTPSLSKFGPSRNFPAPQLATFSTLQSPQISASGVADWAKTA